MILKGLKKNLSLRRKLRSLMTPAENKLWLRIKDKQLNNLKFRRQHGIGQYIVDFYCPEKKIVIEVDGDIHAENTQIVKDKEREIFLTELGLCVLRYQNNDILRNLEGVMEELYEKTKT